MGVRIRKDAKWEGGYRGAECSVVIVSAACVHSPSTVILIASKGSLRKSDLVVTNIERGINIKQEQISDDPKP